MESANNIFWDYVRCRLVERDILVGGYTDGFSKNLIRLSNTPRMQARSETELARDFCYMKSELKDWSEI